MYSLCLCLKEGNHGMHLPDTAWKIWEEEEEEVLIASRCMCVSPSILCSRFVNRRCQFLWWDLGVDRFCDWPLGWIGLNPVWMTRYDSWPVNTSDSLTGDEVENPWILASDHGSQPGDRASHRAGTNVEGKWRKTQTTRYNKMQECTWFTWESFESF